jgi:F0F1-type ATP synthase membrane subunit b/b'
MLKASAYIPASLYGGILPSSTTEVKAKLFELELEKEESEKALELLKQLRDQERKELRTGIERAKEEGGRQAEEVRTQMADRIEKQLVTIENLIRDKEALSIKLEQMSA